MTKLDDEIRAALCAEAPTDEERVAWARAALETAPTRRRRLRPIWPLLTAAAIAGVYLLPRSEEPTHTQEDAGDRIVAVNGFDVMKERVENLFRFIQGSNNTAVAREREGNREFLKQQTTLANARAGFFAVVVGGDSMQITPILEDALKWAEKLSPEAKHRFVFKVKDGKVPGDVIFDRSRVSERLGGSWFLDEADLEIDERGEVTHGRKSVQTKKGALELEVAGKVMTVQLDKKAMSPLMLPQGRGDPRFEIPGRTILEHLDRRWFAYRRYLVRVRHKGLGLDEWVEALGEPKWFGVRLGGHVFQALSGETLVERARTAKRPLLVLRMKDGSQEYLNELFSKVEIGNFEQIVVTNAAETVVEIHHRRPGISGSSPLAALTLADASRNTVEGLQRVVR